MWQQRANELHRWLQMTQQASHGAKDFLRERMGVRPAVPFVPVLAFGLDLDPEMKCAPLNQEQGADPRGWDSTQN